MNWERKYRFESTDSFQYPAFAEHEGAVWLTVSQAGRSGPASIMFGRLEDLPKPAVKVTQEHRKGPFPPSKYVKVELHLR